MRFEIHKHWEKLKQISKLSEFELKIAYDKLLTKLTFVNEALIPKGIWKKAEATVAT
jgi:hypothetical protein